MPIRGWAVLTGHIVASLVRNLVATGVVIGVALLVGFRPTGGAVDWLLAIAFVALYILAITSLFAAIGLAASSPDAASGYGFILLFLPYLSSAFVPVETMPTWLQWFSANQPITPLIETIRGLLMGGDTGAWLDRARLERRHHRRRDDLGRLAVPARRRRAAGKSCGSLGGRGACEHVLRLREVFARDEHLVVGREHLGLRVEVAAAAGDAVRDRGGRTCRRPHRSAGRRAGSPS